MGVMRGIRRWTRAAIAPSVLLLLTGYFGWQATQGEHGLETYALRQRQLRTAEQELARAEAEQHGWEHRVAALHMGRLDLDMLDEQARARLNLADPADIVLSYPPGKRLF
jgi:cell division protein FtsB